MIAKEKSRLFPVLVPFLLIFSGCTLFYEGTRLSREIIPPGAPADVGQEIDKMYSNYYRDRKTGLEKLGGMGRRAMDATPFILDRLQNDPQDVVRIEALKAIVLVDKNKAFEYLTDALKNNRNDVKKEAAEMLGKSGNVMAADPLIQALQDKNGIVRMYSIDALGELNDPRAVMPLVACLNDKSFFVRLSAVHVLGKMKDGRAVDPLLERLKDENENVRKAAVEALEMIGDVRAVEGLQELIRDEDKDVRAQVFKTLLKFKDKRSVKSIIYALENSEDQKTRMRAVKVLGELRDPLAVDALIQVLVDEHFQFQMEAADALGKIGDEKAVGPLIAILKSTWIVPLKVNASEALRKITGEDYGFSVEDWEKWWAFRGQSQQ